MTINYIHRFPKIVFPINLQCETNRHWDYRFGRFYCERTITLSFLSPWNFLILNADRDFWNHLKWVLTAYSVGWWVKPYFCVPFEVGNSGIPYRMSETLLKKES